MANLLPVMIPFVAIAGLILGAWKVPFWPRWWPFAVFGYLAISLSRIWLAIIPQPDWARHTIIAADTVWQLVTLLWLVRDLRAGRLAETRDELGARLERIP